MASPLSCGPARPLRWLFGFGLIGIVSGSLISPASAEVEANADTESSWWKGYFAGSRVVKIQDGRQINLYCEGVGEPTVVMESGLGSAAWTWRPVQDEIAKGARVCVYDRAGYFARSTPAKGPRTAGHEADDLSALLQAAQIKPPYVLVGASYGGYIVRLYAYRHPQNVAGLVLVDPSSEYQKNVVELQPPGAQASDSATLEKLTRCASESRSADEDCVFAGQPRDLPADLAQWFEQAQDADYASATLRETEAMNAASSAQLVAEKRSLGAIPVLVLEQTSWPPGYKPSPEMQAFGRIALRAWHRLHLETLSGISSRFVLRPVEGASHRIEDDKPQAVIDGVNEVLALARKDGE